MLLKKFPQTPHERFFFLEIMKCNSLSVLLLLDRHDFRQLKYLSGELLRREMLKKNFDEETFGLMAWCFDDVKDKYKLNYAFITAVREFIEYLKSCQELNLTNSSKINGETIKSESVVKCPSVNGECSVNSIELFRNNKKALKQEKILEES